MLTHISPDAARLLPNKTAPEPEFNGSSGYVVVLNVFHDLHCLDNLRKGFYYFLEEQWNSTHNPYVLYDKVEDGLQARGGDHLGTEHLDHCIDSLRQSIQCSADVVPNVFQYDTQTKDIRARSTVVHECRDFEKVDSKQCLPSQAPGAVVKLIRARYKNGQRSITSRGLFTTLAMARSLANAGWMTRGRA